MFLTNMNNNSRNVEIRFIMKKEFMESYRKPTADEIRIIRYLAEKANFRLGDSWENELIVKPLTDMRIGPIALSFTSEYTEKGCGFSASDCSFYDTDNIPVALYLLVDEEGAPCELDMWKVDDSPINTIPSCDKLEDIPLLRG